MNCQTELCLPCQQEHQTGWRGRYTGQRCSQPSEQSICTETQPEHHHRLSSGGIFSIRTSRASVCYLCRLGQRVQSDQVDLQRPLLLHGQRQRQVAEGIEGHGDFRAHGTDQGGFEEAVEDVHNDGVVSLDVVLPGFLCYHLQDMTGHK